MHPWRVVSLKEEDWAAPVGDEMLSRARKQPIDVHTSVLSARIFRDVLSAEGEEVDGLLAL
jgi:hypothetical protein